MNGPSFLREGWPIRLVVDHERLPIVTADRQIAAYDGEVIGAD